MSYVLGPMSYVPILRTNKFAATSVSYTHLRAHETVLDLVCRLLLEKKNNKTQTQCIYPYTKLPPNYSTLKLPVLKL